MLYTNTTISVPFRGPTEGVKFSLDKETEAVERRVRSTQ